MKTLINAICVKITRAFINMFLMQQKDAQGIILGCTEIPLLIKQEDTHLPVFNTLQIHAKAAVDFALKD
jgi:aspartate racemase